MYRIIHLFCLVVGLSGCASQSATPDRLVTPASGLTMPEIVSQTLKIETEATDVCLKQEVHFYCGESFAVSFIKGKLKEKSTETRMIENWQVGSIFVEGEVVFVVVDSESRLVWTLPKKMNRFEETYESEVISPVEDVLPSRAGYHCECPEFRKAFSAAAMMSTF